MQHTTRKRIRRWWEQQKALKAEQLLAEIKELSRLLEEMLAQYHKDESSISPSDIAALLRKIHDRDSQLYVELLSHIPQNLLALILLELPQKPKEEAIEAIPNDKIARMVDALESDDAARIIQDIEQYDEAIAQEVITSVTDSSRFAIETVKAYDADRAGAHMQTERFEVTLEKSIGESLGELKALKEQQIVSDVHQVFIVDDRQHFLGSVKLDDLITLPHDLTYDKVLSHAGNNISVTSQQKIDEVIDAFQKSGVPSMAVVDQEGYLLGRITADDVYGLIQSKSSQQIYNLAMVDNKAEEEEDFWTSGKTRAFWLGVNLLTAIAAALVIGLFDATIQSLVALAILMPIVASMGGNAGTQTLTVMVQQMALGEIDPVRAKKAIIKEVNLSLLNGALYAIVMGIIAYVWFDMAMLGVVIGVAMLINLLAAGFFGAAIPLTLKRLKIDPAVGSTVVLTTVTDVVGFFSFLGLATLVLL